MAIDRIHDYIVPGRRAHLVGIGGVSMSPLAEVLHGAGMVITGSDMHESASGGASALPGHPRDHRPPARRAWRGPSCVIRTAAVHDDNPEIAAARAAGIPVFERAQAWGVHHAALPQRPVHLGHPRKDHHHLHVHPHRHGRPDWTPP